MERGRHLITELAATTNISYKKALCIRIRPFNLRHTSPPIPPWASTLNVSCRGLAQGYASCIDTRNNNGQVGVVTTINSTCTNCSITVSTAVNGCVASRTVGSETEVFDIEPNISINGASVTTSLSATKGQGMCEVDVNYSLFDGTYRASSYERVNIGWTVN